MFDRVNSACAMYRGFILIGHHSSLKIGEMRWAIPGGGVASTKELRRAGFFQQLAGPNDEEVAKYACGVKGS